MELSCITKSNPCGAALVWSSFYKDAFLFSCAVNFDYLIYLSDSIDLLDHSSVKMDPGWMYQHIFNSIAMNVEFNSLHIWYICEESFRVHREYIPPSSLLFCDAHLKKLLKGLLSDNSSTIEEWGGMWSWIYYTTAMIRCLNWDLLWYHDKCEKG